MEVWKSSVTFAFMKKCKQCYVEFIPRTGKDIFCSQKCKQKNYRERKSQAIKELQDELSQLKKSKIGNEGVIAAIEKQGVTQYTQPTLKEAKSFLDKITADIAPSGLKFKNKQKKVVQAEKEPEVIEAPKNDKKDSEPKWKLMDRTPKPPSNLTHLQKLAWLADLKNKK